MKKQRAAFWHFSLLLFVLACRNEDRERPEAWGKTASAKIDTSWKKWQGRDLFRDICCRHPEFKVFSKCRDSNSSGEYYEIDLFSEHKDKVTLNIAPKTGGRFEVYVSSLRIDDLNNENYEKRFDKRERFQFNPERYCYVYYNMPKRVVLLLNKTDKGILNYFFQQYVWSCYQQDPQQDGCNFGQETWSVTAHQDFFHRTLSRTQGKDTTFYKSIQVILNSCGLKQYKFK
jgi:hypothetical protein